MPLCVSSTTNSYEVKYSPTKYIDTTERGLVVVSVNEGDAGRYDCYLGGSLLCSYSITVDAHRWVSHLSLPCELKWRRQLLFVHCPPPTLIRCEFLAFNIGNRKERNCNKSNWIFLLSLSPFIHTFPIDDNASPDVLHRTKAMTIRKFTPTGVTNLRNTNRPWRRGRRNKQ